MNRAKPRFALLAIPAVALSGLLTWIGAGLQDAEQHRSVLRAQSQQAVAEARLRMAVAADAAAEQESILQLVREHQGQFSHCSQLQLAEAIYREAVDAQVDPLMVASIIAKESSFRDSAVSHAGAMGLMQLRPWVAADVAERGDLVWHGPSTLNDAELNVRLGIRYFKELLERFDGDQQLALTAYNFGPTRVSRQVRAGTFGGSKYADGILNLYAELREDESQGR